MQTLGQSKSEREAADRGTSRQKHVCVHENVKHSGSLCMEAVSGSSQRNQAKRGGVAVREALTDSCGWSMVAILHIYK